MVQHMVRWLSPPHTAPVVHRTVRGTNGTARLRLVRVQRMYGGAPAALRLWYVQHTREAGTRSPYAQYGG